MNTQAGQINFDSELPISAHVDELTRLLKHNQVIIVCGETGSGKSTQLPKICLHAGLSASGMIAHTQPRRIAARSIATRLSQELNSQLGCTVGYRVRFNEIISHDNQIRVLTDGMLLAEYQHDPLLRQYNVIIIDEAHERSLNIDFLLGLLKRLIVKRPELKVIITSATLDSEKFSDFFNKAPAVAISGRTFPVEIRYREGSSNSIQRDSLNEEILEAVSELHRNELADILIFFAGEREIHAATKFLQKRLKSGIDVLPLYARLSPQEQNRIFNPSGRPRIVLATNVAETSLTVPGIKYVIDTGFARISRYSSGRKIQRLPIERISKAAAAQRSGRCGRVSDGICIRLYSEQDFESRPDYTDPEIVRTSLSDVILKMAVMRLGSIEQFPFLQSPSKKQINDGVNQLIELGALNDSNKLTHLGRQISRLPIDPRIARMLIESLYLNCLPQMITIAAVLSIGDPRVTPTDNMQSARQKHVELSEKESDFLILLDIWQKFRLIQKSQSKRKAYAWCEENYLSIYRMREWSSLQANLMQSVKQSGLKKEIQSAKRASGLEHDEAVHRALLSGLLSHVAILDEQGITDKTKQSSKSHKVKSKQPLYLGTFNKLLKIFPSSCLIKQQAKWIMSAELVETSALFARQVAKIEPSWIEQQARHILRVEYSSPHWHKKTERVKAYQRGVLYGLTVFANRLSDFSKVDSEQARDIFILHALVLGEIKRLPDFLQHNFTLLKQVKKKSNQLRQRDGFASEQDIFDFYANRIPADISTSSDLMRWYSRLSKIEQNQLFMTEEDLIKLDLDGKLEQYYPVRLFKNQMRIPLDYQFNPGAENDGVTAKVEISYLNQINPDSFDRLVPGLFEEKLVALIKTLPKSLRLNFIPVPETVQAVKETVEASDQPLLQALANSLNRLKGTHVKQSDFMTDKLAPHLKMKISLLDNNGVVMQTHHDIRYLQEKYKVQSQQVFSNLVSHEIEKENVIKWDFDDLPMQVQLKTDGKKINAYPALDDRKTSVSIVLFDTQEEADYAQLAGLTRLLFLNLPNGQKYLQQLIKQESNFKLIYSQIADIKQLQDDMFHHVLHQLVFSRWPDIRNQNDFNQCLKLLKEQINPELLKLMNLLKQILAKWHQARTIFSEIRNSLTASSVEDVECQFEWLIYEGFVAETEQNWLNQYPNYLNALLYRLEQAGLNPAVDHKRTQEFLIWWKKFENSEREYDEKMHYFRWMLEEYRIVVFAQQMKKSIKVSEQRLQKQWQELG